MTVPTTSIVPAAADALVAIASAALPTVQVTDYWPGPDTKSEGVFLSDPETSSEAAPGALTIGRLRRDETVVLTFIIQTWRAAPAPSLLGEARTRVWEMYGAIESGIADSPTLNDTAAFPVELAAFQEAVPFETGWAVRITATVTVKARLT